MSARLTAYLPEGAAAECLLRSPVAVRIGRSQDCALVLPHASVSREHAELVPDAGGWRLRDLDSKNGSFVEGARVSERELGAVTWLRFGDVPCEFRKLDAAALERADQRNALRNSASRLHTLRAQRQDKLPDLLQATLAAVVELSGCERGFLLLCEPGGGIAVRAWQGIESKALGSPAFGGSFGAVERAMKERAPLVLNDIGRDAELSARASVIAGGLRTLVCLPLLFGDEVLGLAYADSRQPGALVTQLDLELLCAFADRASLWIAARRSQEALADVGALDWREVAAAHAGAADARP